MPITIGTTQVRIGKNDEVRALNKRSRVNVVAAMRLL